MERVMIDSVLWLTADDDYFGEEVIGSDGHLRGWQHTPYSNESSMAACFMLKNAVSMICISLATVACACVEVEGGQWSDYDDQYIVWTPLTLMERESTLSRWRNLFFAGDEKEYDLIKIVCHRSSDDTSMYGIERMNIFEGQEEEDEEEEELYDSSTDSCLEDRPEAWAAAPFGRVGVEGLEDQEPLVHFVEDLEEDQLPVMVAGLGETRAKGRTRRAPFKGKQPKSWDASKWLECSLCSECVLKIYVDSHYCPFAECVIPKGCFTEAPPERRCGQKRKSLEEFPPHHATVATHWQPLTAGGGEPSLQYGPSSPKRARMDNRVMLSTPCIAMGQFFA